MLTNGRVLAEGRQSLLFTKPEGGAISLELLGRKAVIRIMANKMLLKFHYSCVVDGSAAPEPLAVGCMPCPAVPCRASVALLAHSPRWVTSACSIRQRLVGRAWRGGNRCSDRGIRFALH